MAKGTLTVERLRQVLAYDPLSGEFRYLIRRGAYMPGTIAGTTAKAGYRLLQIDRQFCLAHRLAWLYVHGVWPTNQIDHINGDRADNRLSNLREATNTENAHNHRRPTKAKRSTEYLGVYPCTTVTPRWMAKIKANGKELYLGSYGTPEEAYIAYRLAKARLHPFSNPL